MKGGREDGGDFFGLETGDEGFLCCDFGIVGRGVGVAGAEEADAGPDAEFGQGDVGGEFAEVLDVEWGWEGSGGGW